MSNAKQQIKERPILFSGPMVRAILEGRKTQTRRVMKDPALCIADCGAPVDLDLCPYGQPGDRLWVREAFSSAEPFAGGYYYRADHNDGRFQKGWRPSIHMPRVASRIILEVTSVRVERLRNISEEDATAEGVERLGGIWYRNYHSTVEPPTKIESARGSFMSLWESINGPESWEANPWVWVIEFKKIER